MTQHLFTSESVSMGHPDKVADQISDAVLDGVLAQDPLGRVACEVLLTGNLVVVAGERNSHATIDLDEIVRSTMARIGYDDASGFDTEHFRLVDAVQPQSIDISIGVDREDDTGAGDQGLMFGYASSQTDELMPLPIMLAHKLVARQAEVRTAGEIEGLRPDAKSQVTIRYDDATPLAVESILVSTQHDRSWNGRQIELKEAVIEHVIRPVLGDLWNEDATVLVNPTGQFEIGGPRGDTGLTGRKIIVDTYGGWARHGGGAFSGKDATKVDRSASYMARHVAKHVVAARLARECEVRLGYAIGVAEPTAVWVDTLGTGVTDDARLSKAVRDVFSLTPRDIIERLGLERPIYSPTAYHGHFGRTAGADGTFSWEATPHVDDLRTAADV